MDPHALHAKLVEFEAFKVLRLGRDDAETEALQAQQHQQLENSDDECASAEEQDADLYAYMTKNKKSQVKKANSTAKAMPGNVSRLLQNNNGKGSRS